LFDLNDLIQLHLLQLFLKNSFHCQLESLLFLSLNLHLNLWLCHLQAHLFTRHLLEICSDSSLKSLLFSQSLQFSLQSLSHLFDHLLKMLEIYIKNSSKDSLFLCFISRRVSIFLITHLIAHLATYLLKILVECSLKMSLFSRLNHLLEFFLMIHLSSHSLFSHLMTHLQEFSLVTHLEAHLMTHLLSHVYSWRIYTSCFINSARKNICHRVKDNVSFSSLDTWFRSLSLSHHHVL